MSITGLHDEKFRESTKNLYFEKENRQQKRQQHKRKESKGSFKKVVPKNKLLRNEVMVVLLTME